MSIRDDSMIPIPSPGRVAINVVAMVMLTLAAVYGLTHCESEAPPAPVPSQSTETEGK